MDDRDSTRLRDGPNLRNGDGCKMKPRVIASPQAPDIELADYHRSLATVDDSQRVGVVGECDRSRALVADSEFVVTLAASEGWHPDEGHRAGLRGQRS